MTIGTQSFEDLLGDGASFSKAGRVIIDNSYYNFFLMQKINFKRKNKTIKLVPNVPLMNMPFLMKSSTCRWRIWRGLCNYR